MSMRTDFPVVVSAVLGAVGLLFACDNTGSVGDDASAQPSDASTPTPDGSSTVMNGAAGEASSSGDTAMVTPQAYVRIAQWSPDAPAVDVCFNLVGAPWTGQVPHLARVVAARDAGAPGDAGAAGISFPQVTSYLVIPPGSYEVRLVVAGSADCSRPVIDLATVTLAASSFTTIAALGESTPVGTDQPLSLVPFVDEVSAPPGQIALRFINASPGAPTLAQADLGTGSLAGAGGPFAPLFTGVGFGKTAGSDAGAVDANGYVASTPLATATLSAHPTAVGADATVALNDVTITATRAATVALVNGVSKIASSAPKLLQCADVDNSAGSSLLSTCSIISTQ
jgi:hypothetical protein